MVFSRQGKQHEILSFIVMNSNLNEDFYSANAYTYFDTSIRLKLNVTSKFPLITISLVISFVILDLRHPFVLQNNNFRKRNCNIFTVRHYINTLQEVTKSKLII